MRRYIPLAILLLLLGCNSQVSEKKPASNAPFYWKNANIYFLLTDRFNNGNQDNDINFNRSLETAVNRGFQGGDLVGITKKIQEGYFTDLGITAIWTTPFVEQVHGIVDEGTGPTYGFHGYWAKDWTALDPNFGSEEDLARFIEAAHKEGIRVIMDVVINHTGPVTELDPAWEDSWVRTAPQCTYSDYNSTVTCTLVKNLPDIKTESNREVGLPEELIKKWEEEGRLEQEMGELDQFFERTGYPRTPTYYLIKWLTDYVRKYGIDGYRLDTAKHVEDDVWAKLRKEVDAAFSEWKSENPDKALDDIEFYMVGEVYNYGISSKLFNYGDTVVDFYNSGINSLINFEFKYDAAKSYEELFSKYSTLLNGAMKDYSTLNYLNSHDDGSPFDTYRKVPLVAANKLLLCPGASQVYYGDESSRILHTDGAKGDAHLRSFMNWNEIESNAEVSGYRAAEVLGHYQKLGRFRRNHPAVGAGVHTMVSESPYIFKREFVSGDFSDLVLVGLDLAKGLKEIMVVGIFDDGDVLYDAYTGQSATVTNGIVKIKSDFGLVLLSRK